MWKNERIMLLGLSKKFDLLLVFPWIHVQVGTEQWIHNGKTQCLQQLGKVLIHKRTPHPTPGTSEIQGLACICLIRAHAAFCYAMKWGGALDFEYL